jgi:hypothetical protein
MMMLTVMKLVDFLSTKESSAFLDAESTRSSDRNENTRLPGQVCATWKVSLEAYSVGLQKRHVSAEDPSHPADLMCLGPAGAGSIFVPVVNLLPLMAVG